MLKIRSGLGKTAQDRVVESGFRAPDELGMTFAGTVKPVRTRFCHGIVSESLLKQHHESQFSDDFLKLTGWFVGHSAFGRPLPRGSF